MVVFVPDEVALKLDQFDLLTVQFANEEDRAFCSTSGQFDPSRLRDLEMVQGTACFSLTP
jgi:hypothetical protein